MLDRDLATRIPVSETTLQSTALIVKPTRLTENETLAYVEFAQQLDDGEAQALAIALARGYPLLTDDEAGIKIGHKHGVEIVTTLDLASKWSDGRDSADIRAACRRLRLQARYGIPRFHAQADWYRSQLDGTD